LNQTHLPHWEQALLKDKQEAQPNSEREKKREIVEKRRQKNKEKQERKRFGWVCYTFGICKNTLLGTVVETGKLESLILRFPRNTRLLHLRF
jgi:hypothetical protein